jgi:hypothetical protein
MISQAITPKPCRNCAGCFTVNVADDGRMHCFPRRTEHGSPKLYSNRSAALRPAHRSDCVADQGRHPSESRPAPINLAMAEKVQA